jgi:hypothetical protein
MPESGSAALELIQCRDFPHCVDASTGRLHPPIDFCATAELRRRRNLPPGVAMA